MKTPFFMRAAIAAAVLAVGVAVSGCVKRTIAIDTRPPGARVFYNGVDKGVTPCEFTFDFYGQPEIKLIHPGAVVDGVPTGYEVYKTDIKCDAPWYEWPVLDMFSELVVPFTFHDRHDLGVIDLVPKQPVNPAQLYQRAGDLKTKLEGTAPAGASETPTTR